MWLTIHGHVISRDVSSGGSGLVQKAWFQCGSGVVDWLRYGSGLVHVWLQFGSSLVENWSIHGSRSGSSVLHVCFLLPLLLQLAFLLLLLRLLLLASLLFPDCADPTFCTLLLHDLLAHILSYLATQFQWPKTFCIMERRIMLSLASGTRCSSGCGKADAHSCGASHGRRISCHTVSTSVGALSGRGPSTGSSRMSALKSSTGRVWIERENEGESDEQRQTNTDKQNKHPDLAKQTDHD